MSDPQSKPDGPDFSKGVAVADIAEGRLHTGHVAGEPALLIRREGELYAVAAACTHYGAPLSEGLLVDDTIRCPWHHACFSLRTGAVLRAPALSDLKSWQVEVRGDMAFVVGEAPRRPTPVLNGPGLPASIVIIGGGAAGNAAAGTLRREGYAGPITMLSADADPPYDRPNLSKDYLAGSAEADWLPLRSAGYYKHHDIDLRCNVRVIAIDTKKKVVTTADDTAVEYGALLLATGAEPRQLSVPGAALPHVHRLRTRADCDAILAGITTERRCVIVGSSFIGLEAAAAIRARDIEVSVVAPGSRPLEHVFGPAISDSIKALHERHGVAFHLGASVESIAADQVALSNGVTLGDDLVIVGIGVEPAIDLAKAAGVAVDDGVLVDAELKTSAEGVYAAGDISRWPDPLSGERIRVEHWVVAERQGEVAARNMLGQAVAFDAVPFFWTQQYDLTISYVGHAVKWDRLAAEGDPAKRDCKVTYFRGDKPLAVATIGRDLESLEAELAFEREGL